MLTIRLTVLMAAALLLAACGGDGGGVSPTSTSPPEATLTPLPPLIAALCQDTREPRPQWNVQITARWEGKDRIVIEGQADLSRPGTVNYWVCQDGQPTTALQRAVNPEFKDGKITAESKVIEGEGGIGPPFDPNAHFDVMVSILGQPVQVPYFTVRVPVEGKPE